MYILFIFYSGSKLVNPLKFNELLIISKIDYVKENIYMYIMYFINELHKKNLI